MTPTIIALSVRAAFGPIPGAGLHSAGWIWFRWARDAKGHLTYQWAL